MNRICCGLLAVVVLAALPSPAGAGSAALDAALSCRKGMTKMGEFYTHKRRVLLLNCVDKLLKCEVQKEVDGTNPGTCRTKAENSCKNTLGSSSTTPLSVAGAKYDTKAGAYCAAADFTTVVMAAPPGALGYSNDVECGASVDLGTLLDCLREQLAMSVDETVGTLKPRAGILLDNIGLGANFPDIPRPPTTDVLVSRTMAGNTGTLINPSPIMVASGTAVRFSGDAATLSCGGMGNNARLTVTILPFGSLCSDPTLQDLSIKEPFGPGNTVTAGPFTSDATFCLHFKDGGSGTCDETISGTIDLP